MTRRDPSASRPPSAYGLLSQTDSYEVWGRLPGAPAALAHIGRTPRLPVTCAQIGGVARTAQAAGVGLVAAMPVDRVTIDTTGSIGLRQPDGGFESSFEIPRTGTWELWVRGEMMAAVRVTLDGRTIATIKDQVSGNAFNPDTMVPIRLHLTGGLHRIGFTHDDPILPPGSGGSAYLYSASLTRPGAGERERLVNVAPADWRSLCADRPQWVEATVPTASAPPARTRRSTSTPGRTARSAGHRSTSTAGRTTRSAGHRPAASARPSYLAFGSVK